MDKQTQTQIIQLINQEVIPAIGCTEPIAVALASAKASKQSILAQIESYQKTLNDATITAPISGIIAQCNVKPNTVLAQGSTVPFVIIDLSSVNIEVNVAEQIIPYIAVGNEVDVLVSTVSPEYMKGNITSINPVAASKLTNS